MLIDTHCHLTDEKFRDVHAVISEAANVGVKKIIIPGTSLEDSKRAAVIANQEGLYSLAGIHPEEVDSISDIDFELREIIKLLNLDQVVGIGEIGLDFYWDKEKKSEASQRELFRKQMLLASDTRLPAVIHMRNSETEMTDELLALKHVPRGQFHCFTGSSIFLDLILSMGFYVSFCGNITYKSAGDLRNLLKSVPLDRLLLETDSPYLPPEPLRGTVNSPANVKIVAEFIARELNIETQELAEITTKNAKCLYLLDI